MEPHAHAVLVVEVGVQVCLQRLRGRQRVPSLVVCRADVEPATNLVYN